MNRLRLIDFRLSRGPQALGIVQGDLPSCARILNAAQQRLLFAKECGDEGWHGTFAEMAFSADPALPYITMPRGVARIGPVTSCGEPIPLYNQFYEYLQFGNGSMPKCATDCKGAQAVYTRNNVVTFVDMTSPPQKMRIYPLNPLDAGKRVFISGLDSDNRPVYTKDNEILVQGEFVTLEYPSADTVNSFNAVTGIQKDVTAGNVQYAQLDPTSAAEVVLLTMEPTETTGWYRRYYFDSLPSTCCLSSTTGRVLVKAIAKLDLIPVTADTDFCLIQNLEALIEECQAIRLGETDSASAQQQGAFHHAQAIRMLIGELTHYLGKNKPAVDFKPFGFANLRRLNLSMK